MQPGLGQAPMSGGMRQDGSGGRGLTRLAAVAKAGDTPRCPRLGLDAWGPQAPFYIERSKRVQE
jgi:hypothetical protein